VTSGGALGSRLSELIILRVGVHVSAWYEWGSHVDRAQRVGLTLDEIKRTLSREVGPDWSAEEAALLAAVDELVETHALSDATRAALAGHFTPPQLLDVIATQGLYTILGCMIRSWGLDLDTDTQSRIEGLVTREGFQAAAARFHGAP
jgi:alkylhydroperoxidase family enzyme